MSQFRASVFILMVVVSCSSSWGVKYIRWENFQSQPKPRRTCATELAAIAEAKPTLWDYTGDPDLKEVAIETRRAVYKRLADVGPGELYPYMLLGFRYAPLVSAWKVLSQAGWQVSLIGEQFFDVAPEAVLQPFMVESEQRAILLNHHHFETDPNIIFPFAVSLALSETLSDTQIDQILSSLTTDTRQHLQSLIDNEFLALDDAADSWGGGTATLVEAPALVNDREPYGYDTQAEVARSVVGYVLGELARTEFYLLFRQKHSWIANANDDGVSAAIVSSRNGLQMHLEESLAEQYEMQGFAAKDLLRAIVNQKIPEHFGYPALVQEGEEIFPKGAFPNAAHRLERAILFRY